MRSRVLHIRLCSIEITFNFVSRDGWIISNLSLFCTVLKSIGKSQRNQLLFQAFPTERRLGSLYAPTRIYNYQRYSSSHMLGRGGVLWLFGQQVGASRDAGEFEKKFFFGLVAPQRLPLFYRRNLALTEFQYPIPQSLYWRPPADQKARGPWVRDWVYGGMWCV